MAKVLGPMFSKILFGVVLVFFVATPFVSFALDWPLSPGPGGVKLCPSKDSKKGCPTASTLTQMIEYFYRWAIVLGGLVAFIMLVVAGFEYLTSAGDPGKTKSARDRIGSAIGGLVLLLSSVLILNIINPELTTLRVPPLKVVNCSDPKNKDDPQCKSISDDRDNLPPAGSCAYIELYSLSNYDEQSNIQKIEIKDRKRGVSKKTTLDFKLSQEEGSLKVFSYMSDDQKIEVWNKEKGKPEKVDNPLYDRTNEGGLCTVAFYEKEGCQGKSHSSFPSSSNKDLGSLQMSKDTKCIIISVPAKQ